MFTAVAQIVDPVNLIFVEGDSPNERSLNNSLCVEIVPPGFPGFAQVTVSAFDELATRKF